MVIIIYQQKTKMNEKATVFLVLHGLRSCVMVMCVWCNGRGIIKNLVEQSTYVGIYIYLQICVWNTPNSFHETSVREKQKLCLKLAVL